MAEIGSGPAWTKDQWDLINRTVTETFGKSSVAAAFVPCFGPLGDSSETVRLEEITVDNGRVRISADRASSLVSVSVKVELSTQQVAEELLSSALLAFRRAANILAYTEDSIVFNGAQPSRTGPSQAGATSNGVTVEITPGEDAKGLVDLAGGVNQGPATTQQTPPSLREVKRISDEVFRNVAKAVIELEEAFHPGPFACILGSELFVAVQTPTRSDQIPADRIAALLVGPTPATANGVLLRSSNLNPRLGVVVSMGDPTIDIVVATPPKVQFLQVTENAKYLFRVYERFLLRSKDPADPGVRLLQI